MRSSQRTKEEYDNSLVKSKSFCGTVGLVGCSFSGDGRAAVWKKGVGCGRWECKVCGRLKVKRLRRRIKKSLEGQTLRLMTLTVAQGEWEVGDAMQEIKHGWDVLAKRLRRLHPGFKYVCVFEITKAGYPHLHVLMNSFVSHQWLSRAWAEIMRSPIVHIERVKDVGAVRYVTKYLSKFAGEKGGVNEAAFIWRIRRFTFSRGYIAKSEQWRSVIFYKGRLYAWADYCFDSLVAEFCDCWDGVSPGKDGLVIFFGDNSPGVVS